MSNRHEAVYPLIRGGDRCCIFNADSNTRDKEFLKRHSFRVEETWAMDFTFATWLYEHLVGYVEAASSIVDLEYHEFKYEGKTYKQLELINLCLDKLKEYLVNDDLWVSSEEPLLEAARIWVVLLPAMWW